MPLAQGYNQQYLGFQLSSGGSRAIVDRRDRAAMGRLRFSWETSDVPLRALVPGILVARRGLRARGRRERPS